MASAGIITLVAFPGEVELIESTGLREAHVHSKRSLVAAAFRGPANKRVFHLVYRRGERSGVGKSDSDESKHLKNQVLVFAKELRRITEEFARHVEPRFASLVRSALEDGLNEGARVARSLKIANPL